LVLRDRRLSGRGGQKRLRKNLPIQTDLFHVKHREPTHPERRRWRQKKDRTTIESGTLFSATYNRVNGGDRTDATFPDGDSMGQLEFQERFEIVHKSRTLHRDRKKRSNGKSPAMWTEWPGLQLYCPWGGKKEWYGGEAGSRLTRTKAEGKLKRKILVNKKDRSRIESEGSVVKKAAVTRHASHQGKGGAILYYSRRAR